MTAVIFDPDNFRSIYPAFADETKVSDEALEDCFETAETIIGNDDGSLIPYEPEATPPVKVRQQALYALTCHLATMRYLWDATQAGALNHAAQGSVSAGFAINTGSAEWWNRTACGATAYMLLQRYASGPAYFGAVYVHRNG